MASFGEQLQQVVFFARFQPEDTRGDARVGWVHILAVHDYAALAQLN
jgi:hypothetical protein